AIDAVQRSGGAEAAAQARTTLATVVLTVPLIAFSVPAGLISDRFSKRTVIIVMKAVEIVLMAAAAGVLFVQPQGGVPALVILGCMGAQSALFSPSKYGILPELLPHSRLSLGNGVLEMWSTLAIIAGTASAGLLLGLAGPPWIAGALLCVLSLAGFGAALTVPAVPAARSSGGLMASLREGWSAINTDRVLRLAVLGSIFFWLVASIFFQVIVVYVKTHLGLANAPASMALGVLMAGIAAGSIVAGRLSRRRVEYGLLPLGATALAVFTLLFGLLVPGFTGTLVLLFMMGIAGGLINVPLNALKQWRSPSDRRGSVLALSNLFVYVGILVGSLGTGLMATAGFSSQAILLLTGAGVVAATAWALWLLPDALIRLLLVLSTNSLYRLEVLGGDHIPAKGGALLVPNHVSFIDAFLLLAGTDRPIRFLADVTYYNHPLLHPFMRSLGAIPIASSGGPKLILQALRAAGRAIERGEIVCIFPEGQITRIGMMLPFRRGFERIIKGHDVPIVPVFLDRVWGSIFSRAGGRFFTKVPTRIPYPVTINVGEPLPADTPIHEVRRAVRELGTEAWMARVSESAPLHHSFVRCFRSRPWKLGFADATRPHVSRFKALVGAIALARALRTHWEGQSNVGILLPSTVGGALVNIAAALAGKVSVNLNFTAGKQGMESAARQAGLSTVVTNGLFVAKAELDLPEGVKPIWIEEVAQEIGAADRIAAMLLALFAPIRRLERACGAERPVQAEDLVTIIFSSGSTGEPKGVPLTHFNVDSNLRGCLQTVPISSSDRLIGMLPFFHSFGFMATLWMVANIGVPVIYHPSPLDTTAIGDLVRRYRATLMFATPTFLQLYTRRITPGQFGSLRLVVAGAEKLQPAIADAFRDHFGFDPLEGYGVTETSPAIAINVPDFRAAGLYQPGWRRGTVGQTIPGVSVRVVHPESDEILPPGEEGMILVRGPNVMAGYLDRPDLTAEVLREGWYVTGDIGKLDEDGFLKITDRYSRFSKIGGEMVPHGIVEEALERCSGVEDRVFAVTAVDDVRRGERLAVLHTLEVEDVADVLDRLRASDLPNLFLPRKDDFVRVDEIPLLGSGKTDLKAVKETARKRLLAGAS
ncbi:MAG TPA: acyl-[ACP]--phospholipid O-acyltransferase, partial [Acidobacteriota bacterium]|nr:acyl-[ACP]--phospholipid O-acyltransferase [Acidobacteriota bacterium]